ncbi:MAG: DUF2997 domain-containing protein [Lentisphaeria bacterium]
MKRIDVDIGTEGEVEIDALGFFGPACEQTTRFLEDALGDVQTRSRKPEYRRRANVQRQQVLRNGETGS